MKKIASLSRELLRRDAFSTALKKTVPPAKDRLFRKESLLHRIEEDRYVEEKYRGEVELCF